MRKLAQFLFIWLLISALGASIFLTAQYYKALGDERRENLRLRRENTRLREKLLWQEYEEDLYGGGSEDWGQAGRSIEEIQEEIQQVRGLTLQDDVPTVYMDEEELAEYLPAQLFRGRSAADVAGYGRLVKALGLVEPTADVAAIYLDVVSEQAAAFYDEVKKCIVLPEGQPLPGYAMDLVLAHEFTHALQDQNFGLEGLGLTDTANGDRALAALCLVEGDATLAMAHFMGANMSLTAVAGLIGMGLEDDAYLSAPQFIRRAMLFPYTEGVGFVSALYAEGGWTRVDQAFADLPASTEQVLHPARYMWERDEPTHVALPDISAHLPAVQVLFEDTFGEAGVLVVLESGVEAKEAALAAAGWDGDRIAALGRGDETAVVWSTAWDSATDAEEFASAAERMQAERGDAPPHRVQAAGAVALFVQAPDEALLAALWSALSPALPDGEPN